MRGARTRRRRNPRFAALCLLLIFAAVGAAVWLWAGRGLPGEGVEVPDYVQADLLTVNPWSRHAPGEDRWDCDPLRGQPRHHGEGQPELL